MNERTRELLILIIGDLLCFVVAVWATLLLRYLEFPTVERLHDHFGPFALMSVLWLSIFYMAGLYDKHTVLFKSFLLNRIVNTQLVNVVAAAGLFLIIPFGITPKTNLAIYLLISTALIAGWRLWLYNFFLPETRYRAILIADGKEAVELVDEINNNSRYNYSFVRILDKEAATVDNFEHKLIQLIKQEKISIIVANPRSNRTEKIMTALFEESISHLNFTFFDFFKLYENIFDRVPLSALQYDWFITHASGSGNLLYAFFKRLIDITGGIILGLILLILVPFIKSAVWLEGVQKKIFMTQKRIGQHNTLISVLKLQTMTQNDANSATWMSEDTEKGNAVTRVGAFLRRTSLDELPQVWNIIKGEMSLIGPRNDIEGLGRRLAEEIPYYNIRNYVKPGVSGWAQTHQHYMSNNISPQSIEESQLRLAYDLYYIKNRSFMLDIAIVMRTIKTLLSRFGGFKLNRRLSINNKLTNQAHYE